MIFSINHVTVRSGCRHTKEKGKKAQSGVGYFSTPWTRHSFNTDERTQKVEGNMEDNTLENFFRLKS